MLLLSVVMRPVTSLWCCAYAMACCPLPTGMNLFGVPAAECCISVEGSTAVVIAEKQRLGRHGSELGDRRPGFSPQLSLL